MICSAHFWGASLRVCFSIFNLCWYSQIVGLEVEQRDKTNDGGDKEVFPINCSEREKVKGKKTWVVDQRSGGRR